MEKKREKKKKQRNSFTSLTGQNCWKLHSRFVHSNFFSNFPSLLFFPLSLSYFSLIRLHPLSRSLFFFEKSHNRHVIILPLDSGTKRKKEKKKKKEFFNAPVHVCYSTHGVDTGSGRTEGNFALQYTTPWTERCRLHGALVQRGQRRTSLQVSHHRYLRWILFKILALPSSRYFHRYDPPLS